MKVVLVFRVFKGREETIERVVEALKELMANFNELDEVARKYEDRENVRRALENAKHEVWKEIVGHLKHIYTLSDLEEVRIEK